MSDTRRPRARGNAEGSVYRDQRTLRSGEIVERWVAQVTVNGSKRRTIHPTEARAKRALRDLLAVVDAGLVVDDGNLTVAQLLAEWQTKALPNRNVQPATVARHAWACGILTDELGRRRARALTPEMIEEVLARRAERGLSKASLTKLRGTLGMALAWAERRGKVSRNVAAVAELPADARPSVVGRSLTAEQARAFVDAAAGTRLEAMWIAMLYLGLRPGEAAGLSWADVDLGAGVVHVRQALKRGARGELLLGPLKTTQSARSLSAPPFVVEALRARSKRQKRERLAAGELWRNPDDLVFTTGIGSPIDPSKARYEFRKILTAGALPSSLTPNHLRHTAASLLSDAGVPLEVVADQLGHKDTRMASLHYRHRVRPTIDAANVMADVLDTRG
jgi:integrase